MTFYRDPDTHKLFTEDEMQARFENDLLGLIGNDRDEEALEMTFEDWLRESTFLDERLTATTTFCESPRRARGGLGRNTPALAG
jgi:hypothetical protein